ncbi:MAG: response regulator [bacterium]
MENKKVLVVDDDMSIIQLITVNLEDDGWNVYQAQDGTQAVQAAHREKPSVIILDIMLPAGSGQRVLEHLQSSTITAFIPVILMSALSQEDLRKKYFSFEKTLQKSRIVDFFRKPFDIELLKKSVNMQHKSKQ